MRVGKAGRSVAAAACVAGALIAGGCGSSSSPASPSSPSPSSVSTSSSVTGTVDPVATAAQVSNASPGYKMKLALQIQSPALPSAITATGGGSFDPARRIGSVNLNMNLGSIPGLSAVLGSGGFDITEVVDGTTFYIKLPAALTAKLPGGKPWLKLDLSKLASEEGLSGLSSLYNNPASSNPAAMLQYLRATSGKVTKVGTATIDGYQTTHYAASIDLAKYPKLVPAAQRAQAAQAIAGLEKEAKVSSIPVNVWIDAHNLVRRMTFAFDEQIPKTTQSLKLAATIDFTGYGRQPAPAIPPPSQIGNAGALLGATGTSTSSASA